MDVRVKEVFETFKRAYDTGEDIFNIQLKESYAHEMKKLFDRESTVVEFIKASSNNII